jgi:hypothetical protein
LSARMSTIFDLKALGANLPCGSRDSANSIYWTS